ncbi:MAG: hypothetical protein ABIQ97_00130 [Lysobacteraceae bacterium]
MPSNKIIACIGASEEEVAHLRLLLRTAASQLSAAWDWGTEHHADLIVVDPGNLVGEAARGRALQRGVPCAELIAADVLEPDGPYLKRPLRREDFVALLNGGRKRVVAPLSVLSQGADFFMVDLGEYDDDDAADMAAPLPWQRELPSSDELDDFESLFKRDDLAATPQFMIPDKLKLQTGVEYTGEQTDRSSRNALSRDPFATEAISGDQANIDPSLRSFSVEVDEGEYPLRDYLSGTLLGGPSAIVLPGLPLLVLDPKQQMFHVDGGLKSLEGYCGKPLRRSDWRNVLSVELADVRARIPAQPYIRLQWLDRMITANGYLASHLDPGGSYRLTHTLELAQDYPHAFRIGEAMLGPMQKLHDIVAASNTSMAEVFSVVSAFEAVGYVKWQLRDSMLK